MGKYDYRHHLRLDEPTEKALEQVCRCTFTSKSTLMRRYVQQGVARDIGVIADQIEGVMRSSNLVEAFTPGGSDSTLFGHCGGWGVDEG